MKRALSAWERPPRALHRPTTQMDNIAIVPASELVALHQWQQRAQRLPSGNTLVVVPSNNPTLQQVGRKIAQSLKQRGRRSLIATIRPCS